MLRVVFSRIGIIAVLIILQFLLLYYTFSYLVGWSIVSVIMLIYLLNSNHNPSVKLTWTAIVALLPIFGTLLYWFIQLDLGHRVIKKNLDKIEKDTKDIIKSEVKIPEDIDRLAKYLKNEGNFNVYQDTDIRYYSLGKEMFSDMLKDLKQAKDFIFLEYFIIEKGFMWESILEILKEKANEGLEIRVLYDGTNVIKNLPLKYPEELEKFGIKTGIYAPLKPFLSTYYNNRDHRKIMVIDGKISYTGGINIADEYINKKIVLGHWKDTGVRLDGSATKEFTLMFLKQWSLTSVLEENYNKYIIDYKRSNEAVVIPYCDNPFDKELIAESVYMDVINNAKEYVYIATPYFVTDNEILVSLKNAAKSGIDVRIILPQIVDKEYAFILAQSYFMDLIKAGVKIYRYIPGFVHAKMFVSDDIKAIVGTINMDYRSLYQNFECAVYMHKHSVIKDIKSDFISMFDKSYELTEEIVKKEKLYKILLGKFLKFIAPLI